MARFEIVKKPHKAGKRSTVVYMEEEMKRRLKELSWKQGITMNAILNQMIDHCLEDLDMELFNGKP